MQVEEETGSAARRITLLRHLSESDDVPAIGCIVESSANSLVLVLPRPISIDRSQVDVIRVTLASSLAAVPWDDLDAVLFSDAACLICLPWVSKKSSQLTSVVCSSSLLRLAGALLDDVFLGQHVVFEVAGASLSMFVTSDILTDCVRMLCPAYRLSPLFLLGGGTIAAFCLGADPGSVGWVISRGDTSSQIVVSRQHTLQPQMAFGALDDIPPAPPNVPRSCLTLAGVSERATMDAAAAARSALAAGGCVLGVAHCPFAIARFILLLQETRVPMFWMGPKSEDVYDCLHKLAEYCNDDMLRQAYDRKAPFVLKNEFGEISIVTQQDLSCSTECIVVACCPSVDFVSAWTFSKPTSNIVLRFH
jgi:hypothetical protein